MILRSRRVVLPTGTAPATLHIEDGRIVEIAPFGDEGEDLGELVLLPGLVDTHVHVNEPGRTEWEGFATATRAAAAGGVTTIIDMPLNSLPPTVDPASLLLKWEAAQSQSFVDVGFWGGAIPTNVDDLAGLWDEGVFGFKAFLVDSGVPEFPPLTAAALREAMRAVPGALFVVHAEDPALLHEAAPSPRYADFVDSRPPTAESSAIAWVIAASAATGARAHILHLSAAAALPQLRAARAEGVPVTAETCPHYLTLRARDVPDGATQFKCCPPIRDGANQDLLWAALRDGTLHCVVSDHSPSTPALKEGDFATAWGGIASLQVGLPVVWTAARRRGYTLDDVVRWMASGPADLVGLAHKGRIEVGADADLVAFDPDEEWIVSPTELLHRHPVTPYAGQPLTGVVQRTWLRGALVDGVTPHGQLLRRGPADLGT